MDKRLLKQHSRICRQLNIDSDCIRLVGPTEYKQITQRGVTGYLGFSDSEKRVIYVSRNASLSTHYHEILHILFPSRPHWWIYASAWKLAGLKSTSASYGYGHGYQVSAERMREVPARAKLIRLCQLAAVRLTRGEE